MKKNEINEILKCGSDVSYFINTHVKIQHPIKGLIPFKTFSFQDKCLSDFEEHQFNITLKSRQLGLSTISAAYAVWLAIFHREKNILVIATKLQTAMNFIKKVKVALVSLPPWLKLAKEISLAKTEVLFDNGSQIKAIPTSEDAGRSEALSLLIVDEAAFIRDFGDIWTGLYPTLSCGGRAIIISTPNGTSGVGAQYYRMFTEAEAGQNDFNPIRLEWSIHPEHDQKWFDKQSRQLGDPKRIAQELLCDFLASGDTFLQPNDLEWLRSQIREPLRRDGYSRNVWVWKDPEPDKLYVMSSDVARGDAADYSTFHVIDTDTNEVVAEFMGKLPPDRHGEHCAEWGKKYNNALMAVESNTYGYMTNVKLRDLDYPNLFYKKAKGNFWAYKPDDDELPGFDQQKKTRTQILSKLEESFRNKSFISYSRRLYEQLNTFIWNNGKPMASSDAHDDLVISAAIGCWIVDGGGTATEDGSALTVAMLNAMSKCQSARPESFRKIDEIKPMVDQNLVGSNPYSVYRPRDSSQVQRQYHRPSNALNNFDWLMGR